MFLFYDIFPLIIESNKINWRDNLILGLFTLLGSGLGAFLAGKFALDVVKKQLIFERKSNELEVFEHYVKSIPMFLSYFLVALNEVKEFDLSLREEAKKNEIISDKTSKLLESSVNNLIRAESELEKIKLTIIPYDDYEHYVNSKASIYLLRLIYEKL